MTSPPHTLDVSAPPEDLQACSIQRQWDDLMANLVAHEGDLLLDLRGVRELDLSGVHLLASLEQTLRTSGRELRIVGLDPVWDKRFQCLGFYEMIEDVT